MMILLPRLLRFCRICLHAFSGVLLIRLALLWDGLCRHPPMHGLARKAQARWCLRLCRLARIRLSVHGEPLLPGPVLVAANHVSWLDIPCVAAIWGIAFLSKSEVSRWPLIGNVATGLGTLYIGRGDGAGEAIQSMIARLRGGQRVLFFPEGTTGDDADLLPFRPRLYQAAIDAGVPVQPLMLRYFDASGERSAAAPFVGDQALLAHIWQLCGAGPIEARLWVGQPICSAGHSRSELARRSRAAMLAVREPAALQEAG